VGADPDLVRRIEGLALRAWPALDEIALDGWVLRFSEGYTRRANSVLPLETGRLDPGGKVASCERLYVERGLPPTFKVAPLPGAEGLDALLEAKGYRAAAETSVQVLRDLPSPGAPDPGLVLEEGGSSEWQGRFALWSGVPPDQHPVLPRILRKIKARAFFATLVVDGKASACASGVLDGDWVGLYEVVTAPEARRRGWARRTVEGLLRWAAGEGARQAYLMVLADNAPALGLYRGCGFREAYRYHYRIRT
jgi:ribosomal protein S18 acetylase RimI-like enzyme